MESILYFMYIDINIQSGGDAHRKKSKIERRDLMTKEQLIAAGLTEEQATAVLKLHKDAIDGNYIPKATFEAEREKVKTLNDEVSTRDTQIKELGKFKGTAEQLETKVADLETQNKEAKEKYEADILALNKRSAIVAQITDQVVDVEDALDRLDIESIVFKDGKIVSGLDEEMTKLKETKPHYFPQKKEETPPSGWSPFGKRPPEGTADNPENKDADFGKQLAESRSTGTVTGGDHYFK